MTPELKTLLEFGQLTGDNMSKMKDTHAALKSNRATRATAGCGYERDRGSRSAMGKRAVARRTALR